MASTFFEHRKTVIEADWLNDVNDHVYGSSGVVYVTAFGAVGDGVTNDSVAFNAAKTFIEAQGGGCVLVPSGTYLLNNGISVTTDNVSFVAEGYVTLLKGGNIIVFSLSGNNNEVKGFRINGQYNPGTAILISGNNNTVWFNKVYANDGVGIGQNGRVSGASGNRILFNDVSDITTNTGISTNAAKYGMVAFNQIADVQAEGLANNAAYRCIYIGNMVTDSGGVGGIGTDGAYQTIWANNISYANRQNAFKAKENNEASRQCVLAGNVLVDSVNGYGIVLENNTSVPFFDLTSYSISSNVGVATITTGHNIKNVGDSVEFVFSGTAPDGVYVITALTTTTLTFSIVTADESGTGTFRFVDPGGNYAKEWSIVGNVVDGCDDGGMDIQAPGAVAPGHQIIGNISSSDEATDRSSRNDGRPVAFSATLSAAALNITGNGTLANIPFNTTSYNEGAGFNTTTGVFVAPQSGVHSFTLVVRVTGATGATGGQLRLTVGTQSYDSELTGTDDARYGMLTLSGVYVAKGASVTPKIVISGLAGDTADVLAAASRTWFVGACL